MIDYYGVVIVAFGVAAAVVVGMGGGNIFPPVH